MGKMSVRCLSLGLPLHFQLFRWTWMDSIGFHPTIGYRWSPQDNNSTLPNIYLTSGTLSRRDFRLSYFREKVSQIEFCLFHRITTFSIGIHWCVLDIHGGRNKGKFDNYMICFNSYTKLQNLKIFRLRFRALIHTVQRFPPSEIHTQYYHISVIKKDLDI